MSDTTCPWVNGNSTTQGGKYCDLTHAKDNGCDLGEHPDSDGGQQIVPLLRLPGVQTGLPRQGVYLRRCAYSGERG
ncbi:MAG: hypothetical protein JO243_01955 [Solirubrobacterales bacterium]|nr:hypothetical protein [Solirubrobacterales bacterium]